MNATRRMTKTVWRGGSGDVTDNKERGPRDTADWAALRTAKTRQCVGLGGKAGQPRRLRSGVRGSGVVACGPSEPIVIWKKRIR